MRTSHRLTLADYRTLGLSAVGSMLEFYEFIVFVFLAITLSRIFFPPELPEWLRLLQTFGIFAAGNLARPLGGMVMAHFGDLLGRKRMFMFSIVLMMLPTLGIGLLPSYATIGIWAPLVLLLFRLVQGLAVGGEFPGACVFVAEHVPRHHIGYACGLLCAGTTGGVLLGSLVTTLLNTLFTPEQIEHGAWRWPFLLGAVLGLLAIYLRRYLQETPVFLKMQTEQRLAQAWPLSIIFKQYKYAVMVAMALTGLLAAAIVIVLLMTPTYLQTQFAIPAQIALAANSIAVAVMMLGCIVAGLVVDRLGHAWTAVGGGLLFSLSSISFYFFIDNINTTSLYLLYAFLGFTVGLTAIVPSAIIKLFPAEVRFSGFAFSYNIGYALVGAAVPVMLSLALKTTPMALAYSVIVICGLTTLIGVYMLRKNSFIFVGASSITLDKL